MYVLYPETIPEPLKHIPQTNTETMEGKLRLGAIPTPRGTPRGGCLARAQISAAPRSGQNAPDIGVSDLA
jgi:hypothetical protein